MYTHTCIGFKLWGEWTMVMKPNYEFDCFCKLTFHDLLTVIVSLIVWKVGLLIVWRIEPPIRYVIILHTLGCVIVVYKLSTQVWSCMIMQFLCILLRTTINWVHPNWCILVRVIVGHSTHWFPTTRITKLSQT